MLTGDISAVGRWFADLNQIKAPLITSADGQGHMKMWLQIMSVLKASRMSFFFLFSFLNRHQ